MKNKTLALSFLLLAISLSSIAQQAVIASGGDASGIGGSVSYSIGQVVYTTKTDASGIVAQGVQQVYEISIVGIPKTDPNISLSVFPNPAINNLTLQINEYNNEKLMFQLFDLHGKLISTQLIEKNITEVDMGSLLPATYFINAITLEGKIIKSFKVIKN